MEQGPALCVEGKQGARPRSSGRGRSASGTRNASPTPSTPVCRRPQGSAFRRGVFAIYTRSTQCETAVSKRKGDIKQERDGARIRELH